MRISVINKTKMAYCQELKLQNYVTLKNLLPLCPPDSQFAHCFTVCVHATKIHDLV